MPLASVSIDLDSLRHYCRIQGLPEDILDTRASGLVHEVALPRFLELFARWKVPATLFAIGEDLVDASAQRALSEAHRMGAEIGSHSQSHDYALALQEPAQIAWDLERADDAISQTCGVRPVGFRAPGYTLTAPLYRALCDRGYVYDSSAFPAVPYYALKAVVRGALSLLRRPSGSVLDSPRVLLAPREPYAPDVSSPYRRGDGPVLELPVTTAPFSRIPFIGTLVTMFPTALVRPLYRTLRSTDHFNFELHGIDLLDESDGIPRELARQQRDVLVPVATKLQRLAAVLEWLAGDFELATLADAARRLRPLSTA